jgi:hypothetical protein
MDRCLSFCDFCLTFMLYVLWFTASDYPLGIYNLFSLKHVMLSIQENKQSFYLLAYQGNKMTYLNVYYLQTCNLLIYTNATGSCFCIYFTNVKNFDNDEGTKSNSEIKQTNMSANTKKKNRNSDNRNTIKQTRVKRGQR